MIKKILVIVLMLIVSSSVLADRSPLSIHNLDSVDQRCVDDMTEYTNKVIVRTWKEYQEKRNRRTDISFDEMEKLTRSTFEHLISVAEFFLILNPDLDSFKMFCDEGSELNLEYKGVLRDAFVSKVRNIHSPKLNQYLQYRRLVKEALDKDRYNF